MSISLSSKEIRLQDQKKLEDLQSTAAVSPQVAQLIPHISTTGFTVDDIVRSDSASGTTVSGEVEFSDTNGDGLMSVDEWTEANTEQQQFFGVLIQHFDVDGDGQLSDSEFQAAQMMKDIRDSFIGEDGKVDKLAFAEFINSHDGMSTDTPLTLEQVQSLYDELFPSDAE